MAAIELLETDPWTVNSLRPPRMSDAPFDTRKTGLLAAADVVVHSLPVALPTLDRAVKRFGGYPLAAELDRLCRTYNSEILSALVEGLSCLMGGPRKRGRPRNTDLELTQVADGGTETVPEFISKRFESVQRKYRHFDLHSELQQLRRTFPDAALRAIARGIEAALYGRQGPGRPRLQGLRGPSASTRAFVQSLRLRGRADVDIARCLEHRIEAGQSKLALRKRAQREVASMPRTLGRFNVSLALATELWADTRAVQQIELAIRRLPMTEAQALECVERRKIRFMSRANRQAEM